LQAVAMAMESADPHILTSMDGAELDTRTFSSETVALEEPRAFFFIIFGLVYEALATSSAESTLTTSVRQPAIIASLQALKYLVRPEYSGKALLERANFDEFINLCYRMAMTESAGIQVYLIETLIALTACQNTHMLQNAG
jgi:HEAT repeat-containing protein 5